VARLGVHLLDALEYSHQRGIVHRDIKPGNIILDAGGRPFLMDFGIAKSPEAMLKTRTGMVLGTPAYVAPEQARGEAIDGRADLYALGVTLYQALTADFPFTGSNPLRMVVARLTNDPEPLSNKRPDVDPELAAVVMRSLERDKENRYPTAAEMAERLRWFLGESWEGSGVVPTVGRPPAEHREPSTLTSSDSPTVMDQRAAGRKHQSRLRWGGVGLVAAVVVVAAAYFGLKGADRIEEAKEAPVVAAPTVISIQPATVTTQAEPTSEPSVPPEVEPTGVPSTRPTAPVTERRIRRPATPPRLLAQVEPTLAGELARQCAGRRLHLSVVVAEDGRVSSAKVMSTDQPQVCEAPAVAAVEQYRYDPALDVEGRPVEARVMLAFYFPEVDHD
jgi:serine/threonine-protein kinase